MKMLKLPYITIHFITKTYKLKYSLRSKICCIITSLEYIIMGKKFKIQNFKKLIPA